MLEGKQRNSMRNTASTPAPLGGVVPLVVLLVVMSCVAVIQSSHKSRRLFGELQDLRREAMSLEEEWGRLLLEQSTWASPDRVQDVATQKLKMQAPKMREVKMVRGYGKAG
jgi:cell division protein FtsL